MHRWVKTSALLALLVAAAASSPGSSSTSCPPGGRRQSGCQSGEFVLTVHGYYSGSARADVDATEVSIRGTLNAEDGSTARLEIRDVVVEGPYFAGNGTLGSKSVRITGRLDAAMSSRLSAVFRVSDGHVGRIVGTLPTDPGDPDWLLPSN